MTNNSAPDRQGDTRPIPEVSVLIVTYNSEREIGRCFDALLKQTFRDFEVIVIDNASADGGPVLPEDERFSLFKMSENLGFAAGNNCAAERARAPLLAMLNPDAFAEPDWLEQLIGALKANPGAGMAGSTQIDAINPAHLDGAGDVYHALGIAWRGAFGAPSNNIPPTGEVFGPCAAASIYDANLFRAVGGFDEDFFCYHEDVDLALRLRLQGAWCVQSKEARVHHVGSASTGRRSEFAMFHGVRNRVWTFCKGMPLPLLILLTPFHLTANVLLLGVAWRHGVLVPAARGFWAGLLGAPRMLAKRRNIHRANKISTLDFTRALTWSLTKMATRASDVRKLHSRR